MNASIELPIVQREPLDDFYGMKTFRINGDLYAADTVAQAEISAWEIARECLDLVETELVLKHSGLPAKAAPLIKHLQSNFFFSEVGLLKTIIEDPDALADEAMKQHGRSHFLSLHSGGDERCLSEFSPEIAGYILSELGWPEWDQVCVYKLG